jgi:hypothetical protein
MIDSPEYKFALQFFRSVDAFYDEALPPDAQFLSILERLPNYPKKVINASLPDAVKSILLQTQDWDADKVAVADATLAAQGSPTLTDMRQKFSRRKG